jgi:hypothetical protein
MVDSFDALEDDVQPSPPTEAISDFAYDGESNQWINISTGAVVAASVVTNQMRIHTAATFEPLEDITNQLYDGEISLEQWQLVVASELSDAHLAQAAYGAGGMDNLDSEGQEQVSDTLRAEYAFLSAFALAIANGEQSRAKALARIRQYGRATQQSYWKEFSRRDRDRLINWTLHPAEHCPDCIDIEAGNPYTAETLPTVPGAGDTRCRGNCNCTLEPV